MCCLRAWSEWRRPGPRRRGSPRGSPATGPERGGRRIPRESRPQHEIQREDDAFALTHDVRALLYHRGGPPHHDLLTCKRYKVGSIMLRRRKDRRKHAESMSGGPYLGTMVAVEAVPWMLLGLRSTAEALVATRAPNNSIFALKINEVPKVPNLSR